MTALLSRRLVLPAGQVSSLCGSLGLQMPPGFEAEPAPVQAEGLVVDGVVHRSVAAGLAATCSPRIGVLLRCSVGDVRAAFGIRTDLGGSMVRAGESDVEVAAWPAERLAVELARAVPIAAAGTVRITVVAPPRVIGQICWQLREQPARAEDLGSALAPLVAAGLA